MKYYLYILYDQIRDKYYIGQTNNLKNRLKQHFNKQSKYTKSGNWELIYKESYPTRSQAILREKYLKSLKSKIAIRKFTTGR